MRRLAVALSVTIAGVLGYRLLPIILPAPGDSVEQQVSEMRQLRELLSAETGALSAQRQEWGRQTALLEQRTSELARQLVEIGAQRDELGQQQRQFAAQRELLAAAISRIEAQARDLEKQRADFDRQGPALAEQMAELGRQRRELDRQRREFAAQGQKLAGEMDELGAHRRELERQQRELRALLDQVSSQLNGQTNGRADPDSRNNEAVSDNAGDAGATANEGQAGGDELTGGLLLAGRASVDDTALGEVRGGLRMDDYEISIGLSRTASINGIEQFSAGVYIDDLTKTTGSAALGAVGAMVLQNGPGNTVTPEALAGNLATIIQNTLDNQSLETTTVVDIAVDNVSGVVQGLSASQAVAESLSFQR